MSADLESAIVSAAAVVVVDDVDVDDVKLVPATGQWSMVFNNWVMSMANFLNNGIESMDFVRCVIDDTLGAIWFHQTV